MNTQQKCAGCQNYLPKKDYLQCMKCKGKYDLDCANVSYKLFSIMQKKDQWKCPECHNKKPKSGNINTPVRSATLSPVETPQELFSSSIQHSPESVYNVTQRVKKSECTKDVNPTAGYINEVMLEELKSHMTELFRSQMGDLRNAIASLTNTITTQNSHIEKLEARIAALEDSKETEHHKLNQTIVHLQNEISERDQAALVNDIEISGCPEVPNENCTHLVLTLAHKVGLNIEERDIVSAERVGRKPTDSAEQGPRRARPLVVRLARRAPRDALLRAARVRRGLDTDGMQLPGPATSLYVNERLTKFNRLLFQRARALAKERNYKYTWTRNGRIFVRQEHGKECHRLSSECDLLKVFGKA